MKFKALRVCLQIPNGGFLDLFLPNCSSILGLLIQVCPANRSTIGQKNLSKILRFGICRPTLIALLLLPLTVFGMEFNFSDGRGGWEGDFSDYPVGSEKFYELAWGWENLPVSVKTPSGEKLKKGLFLSGNNHSDDLFMFVKHQIGGLQPDTLFHVNFSVLIETNASAHSVGIGGSPGKSVYFKAGASPEEPNKVALDGYYHLNVDKGNQAHGGENALVLGDLGHPDVDPSAPHYLPKTLSSSTPLLARSDSLGNLWIFLGTDSGFEGITKFYIAQVDVSITPL